jgi:hypothetical protein
MRRYFFGSGESWKDSKDKEMRNAATFPLLDQDNELIASIRLMPAAQYGRVWEYDERAGWNVGQERCRTDAIMVAARVAVAVLQLCLTPPNNDRTMAYCPNVLLEALKTWGSPELCEGLRSRYREARAESAKIISDKLLVFRYIGRAPKDDKEIQATLRVLWQFAHKVGFVVAAKSDRVAKLIWNEWVKYGLVPCGGPGACGSSDAVSQIAGLIEACSTVQVCRWPLALKEAIIESLSQDDKTKRYADLWKSRFGYLIMPDEIPITELNPEGSVSGFVHEFGEMLGNVGEWARQPFGGTTDDGGINELFEGDVIRDAIEFEIYRCRLVALANVLSGYNRRGRRAPEVLEQQSVAQLEGSSSIESPIDADGPLDDTARTSFKQHGA